jgi:asparagine synthase (glutamine-hydrolysing)
MCGISALFAKSLAPNVAKAIVPMTSFARHRGPDDEGFAFFSRDSFLVLGGEDTPPEAYHNAFAHRPNRPFPAPLPEHIMAVLGHRRLAIIDLSPAGHQPFCTADQRYWITYNGEVYNYLEIRQELLNLGHSFVTQTDTEVILQAYAEWGPECLHKFNGMFAFIIYDSHRHRAFVARDRFGVKPLYFWNSPQGFLAFCSEIKQLTILPGWQACAYGQGLYDYLNWGVKDHSSQTLFSGVHQLRGGEMLEFVVGKDDLTSLKPVRWYHLRPRLFEGNFTNAIQEFRSLFEDAIRLRLRADVNIGSCLSGGLDSSSIVCVVNQLLRKQNTLGQQTTFTACSDIKRYDESDYASLVVKHTGVQAHYITPTLDLLFEHLPSLIWHQDEPFGSTSLYAQWSVFKKADQEKVKVILDGQGADEQLAGYHGFFGNHFYDLLLQMKGLTLWKEMKAAKHKHKDLRPLLLLLNKITPDFLRQPVRQWMGKTSADVSWMDHTRLNAQPSDPFKQEPQHSVVHQSIQQLTRSSVPMLLHWEDRNSMAHSVESRTPFLDYRLVEYTLGLPSEFKIKQGWTKHLLREAMQGVLPEPVRVRTDKMGFVTPEEHWIRHQAPERFLQAIQDTLDLTQSFIKPHAMDHAKRMVSGQKPFDFSLWRLICLGEWIKCFSVKC